ncbi:MAG: hypothetical protein QGI45_16625, partial [Myxococcota bacterium]|nr:hypothetical protein [Myxococcota bacterium]
MKINKLPYFAALMLAIFLYVGPSHAWKMEAGEVYVYSTYSNPTNPTEKSFLWGSVGGDAFDATPLVFILPSNNGGNPAAIRFDDGQISTTSFKAMVVEPETEDGEHLEMEVAYFAIEPGSHTLPNGKRIEANSVDLDKDIQCENSMSCTRTWHQVTFPEAFNSQPVVLGQIQSMNNVASGSNPPESTLEPWATTAIRNITNSGFEIALERSSVDDSGLNGSGYFPEDETIAWVAFEEVTVDSFDAFNESGQSTTISYEAGLLGGVDGWDNNCDTFGYSGTYSATPLILATKSSRDDDDGGWLRVCSPNFFSFGLTIDEDRFDDSERSHPDEDVSIFIFGEPFYAEFGASGSLEVDPTEIYANDGFWVTVVDADENLDPNAVDSFPIQIINQTTLETETPIVEENGTNSGEFNVWVWTWYGTGGGFNGDGGFEVEENQ